MKTLVVSRNTTLRFISLAQPIRVHLIWLAALATLSLGTPSAARAQNTAYGTNALSSNTTGNNDGAFGFDALHHNTTGSENSAFGISALHYNTSGSGNTATGWYALYFNATGSNNTATGESALEDNSSGIGNTATGIGSLSNNSTGNDNTATGWNALYSNSSHDNTAIGAFALQDNGSGSNNIAVGSEAGFYLTTGSNNIVIGNQGAAGEAYSILIGTQGTQTTAYVADIFGATVTEGCSVVVESTGQLGCLGSSARYKRDIRDMGDASDKLMKLRPVTFRYKADATGAQQYGLIAEEVAEVYPELVVHDGDGKVETVAYHMLPAMLLNEIQKLAGQLEQKDAEIATLQRQVVAVRQKIAEIDALAGRLEVLERQAQASGGALLASASR